MGREKILYFDCFSGISGDMAMAALLDLGLDSEAVISEIRKLNLSGYQIHVSKTTRHAITGTDVTVILNQSCQDDHHHDDDSHAHDHTHAHDHHGHDHASAQQERNLADILDLINKSNLNARVKQTAISIFKEIAVAEARVHGIPLELVHFHEVGAVDSIVDIVGVAICLDLIGADRILCSTVREGHGFVQCRHGTLPIPVPAVLEMLRESEIRIQTSPVEAELITPTGMGILKATARYTRSQPALNIDSIGYGFGKTETGSLNALRVLTGYLETGIVTDQLDDMDRIVVLETNIDDCSGELLGYTMECLLAAGAKDVFYTPIYMKKNRPAVTLTVLCQADQVQKMTEIILGETSSLGVRYQTMNRITQQRSIKTVMTTYGEVHVKLGWLGEKYKINPEYEDCVKVARESDQPLQNVYRAAIAEMENRLRASQEEPSGIDQEEQHGN